MQTPFGHLTYCTNIHAGEIWPEHFKAIQQAVPAIKQQLSPNHPFGIGLRLSNVASIELIKEDNLQQFIQWLQEQQCYVFTMNGFPYGGFHHTVVKEDVHTPDWTTEQRLEYTIRLANILAALLPEGMEGGISTSPLTYRHWHEKDVETHAVFQQATINLLHVVEALIQLKEQTGKTIHTDIEPEPDGLMETGPEFMQWYQEYLLPIGVSFLGERLHYTKEKATAAIKAHVQLCYDICHFAVGYEDHAGVLQQLKARDIKVGKIQISAALRAEMPNATEQRESVIEAFKKFNEPVYLHQVVARQKDGNLKRYPDLPDALQEANASGVQEWRAHYHVPLFIENYGALQSTQKDIQQVLQLHRAQPFSAHLEIETYTWEVLPEELKLPLTDSIVRELEWVKDELEK
ncbi:xylose isomerase [Ilyomonas limi]|uniref:Xylose isomerase n=1 Tax=Ilyomonas limi TaxID=2575867 RepID=A0A4U3L0K0_9BACT|nr:metabolite traffic protein EboE [Ilyomonas limi]TKK68485.1 xylose isomerase [Ilyomonas limi]